MKTWRIVISAIVLLAIAMLVGQSAGAGAQSSPTQPVSNGFSATLSRPNDQSPYLITFQGRLTDHSGNPITTAVNITFRLYTGASGGSAIFSEGPISLTPNSQGLLTYQVGTSVSINAALIARFAGTLYLGVAVGNDAEMTPRLTLTAAPYALSLAPGAMASGSYSGVGGQYGVINAINTNLSSSNNAGLYAEGATAVYGLASSSGNQAGYGGQLINNGGGSGDQYGVRTLNISTSGRDGYGGQFTNNGGGSGYQYGIAVTNRSTGGSLGYGGQFINNGGGTGNQYGIEVLSTSTGSTATSYGGHIVNNGGGGNDQYGLAVSNTSTRGAFGYAGAFTNNGGGSDDQYGLTVSNSSSGGAYGYGGYFRNNGGGSGTQYGVYAYVPTTGGSPGYSGYFDSNSITATAVYVKGKITATGGCCASANYDTQVQYHGTVPLHPGDVLAADGNNTTIDGTPTLGVVKADGSNADAIIGVVQYRFKAVGKDEKSGSTNWQVDETTTSFNAGDLLSCVFAGQVRMKVAGQAKIGSPIAIASDGSIAVAAQGADNIVGKAVSAPDKDGYVTVFVNVKLGMRYEA